uniref:Uncharacterized protein LOC111108416 isoform X3 n=1 Tax=Crassostrea virginica TaxID=6565 RepID=A0A8B8B989_CRAVI|nr:uncharacterized protein LOC111108416 isoform X3 [Crassostrea virginica]
MEPKYHRRGCLKTIGWSGREDVVTKEESSSWQELSKGGTIPTAASLRVPPTRIGMSTKQDLLQGLTNHEVSQRYIVKLQRERERTNKAVSRSLDNLPIKIKKMVKEHSDSDISGFVSEYKNGMFTSRSHSYQLGMGTKSDVSNTTSHLFQAMPINSLCRHTKRNCSKCHKQTRGRKPAKRQDKDNSDSRTVPTDTETRTSGYDSDFDLVFSQLGEQSMHSEVSLLNGFPVRIQQNLEVETSRELKELRNGYQKVFDANRNVHFVHSSLINNKRVKRLNKPLGRPRLRGSYVPNEEYSMEMMNIRPMYNQSLNKYSRKNSLYPVAPPQSCISENTEYQTPHYHLSDYSYSDADDEYEESFIPERSSIDPDVPRLKLNKDDDDFEGEDVDDEDDNDDKNYEPYEPYEPTSSSRPSTINKKFKTVSDELQDADFVPLSVSALQLHNAEKTSLPKQNSRNFPQFCNLTDITEREESNLTRSTKVISESASDVRMSIRIAYKSGDDVIRELSNISSGEIMVPRMSRQDNNCDVILENISRESERRKGSSTPLDTSKGISKGLNTGYSNLYQESMQDIADTINEARQAMDFIDQTLASKDKTDPNNTRSATPGVIGSANSLHNDQDDKKSENEDDDFIRTNQNVTPIDEHLKNLKIESPHLEALKSFPLNGIPLSNHIDPSTLQESSVDNDNSSEVTKEAAVLKQTGARKRTFFVTDCSSHA